VTWFHVETSPAIIPYSNSITDNQRLNILNQTILMVRPAQYRMMIEDSLLLFLQGSEQNWRWYRFRWRIH